MEAGRLSSVAVAAATLLAVTAPALADAWPQLRGPDQSGRAAARSVFPSDAFGLRLAWKVGLGSGYSGIAVAEGRAVTMFGDGAVDWLVAFDADTGVELWRQRLDPTYAGHDGSDDGPISTPAIDAEVVYALGPRGRLVAVGLTGGDVLWSARLDQQLGARPPDYGFATSPVVAGDVLVVQAGGEGGRAVIGLDKKSGALRWSTGDDRASYQTPLLMQFDGRSVVVVAGDRVLVGIAPDTGQELFRHEHAPQGAEGHALPVRVGDDGLLVSAQDGALLLRLKTRDGRYWLEEAWRSDALEGSYALPVYHAGYLYGFRGASLQCVDAATGRSVWRSRPPGGRGLILVDGHLVIFAPAGAVVVAEASPEGYRERARLTVAERGSYTWPSFAGGKIFVRNLAQIVAVAIGPAPAPVPSAAATVTPAPRGAFAAFLERAAAAADPQAEVEAFVAAHARFPLVDDGGMTHFVWRGQAQDVALAGNMLGPGETVALARLAGTDLFHGSIVLDPAGRWEYQFNLDFDAFVPDPLNPRRVPGVRGVMSELVMPGYSYPQFVAAPRPERRGRIVEREFESATLGNQRKLAVYLPHGYDETTSRYPLLVVLDGEEWLSQGELANALDNLIGERVAPVVVACVGRPPDRPWLELGGSRSGDLARMLAEELVPALEAEFRLAAGPEARAVMGRTGAAFPAALAALLHPGVFGRVAVQSVQLFGTTEKQRLQTLVARGEPARLRWHVDWNKWDARSVEDGFDLAGASRELAEALVRRGYRWTGGEAVDAYGWVASRNRVDRILVAFFPLR